MFKRLFVLAVLCAVLFTTASFAASKKSKRDHPSAAWSDQSLQLGSLPDVGSTLSYGGVGNRNLSHGGGPLGPPSRTPARPITGTAVRVIGTMPATGALACPARVATSSLTAA